MKVPQGFESRYKKGVVLKPNQTFYGLKQPASAFWLALLKAFYKSGFQRSVTDPVCIISGTTMD